MNKISSFIFGLFFLALYSCAYEPILNNKNYLFSLNVNTINGDRKINSIIRNNLNNINGDEINYDLNISTKKEKNIISKNSKGDPSIFELKIDVNYIVKKNGETLIENNISRKTTYNNIADKFELENYEKTLIENISTNISDYIVSSISKINE